VDVERTPVATPPDAKQIEAALGVVPGVARAVVIPDEFGGPGTLRLSLTPDGDEIVVARAVHRILRLQFGVGLEPGRIEVVEESLPEPPIVPAPRLRVVDESTDGSLELGEEIDALLVSLDEDRGPGPRFRTDVLASAARHPAGAVSPDLSPSPDESGRPLDGQDLAPRLAIARLTVSADGLGLEATVTLIRGELEFSGSADGPSTPAAVHRIVAAATIAALADVLGPDHRVDVEAVSVTPVGEGTTVAVVQVVWATVEGSERLTGASEVRDDPRQAVIRATLDAVNRRLAPHLDV
jgi:hypothetical protein